MITTFLSTSTQAYSDDLWSKKGMPTPHLHAPVMRLLFGCIGGFVRGSFLSAYHYKESMYVDINYIIIVHNSSNSNVHLVYLVWWWVCWIMENILSISYLFSIARTLVLHQFIVQFAIIRCFEARTQCMGPTCWYRLVVWNKVAVCWCVVTLEGKGIYTQA